MDRRRSIALGTWIALLALLATLNACDKPGSYPMPVTSTSTPVAEELSPVQDPRVLREVFSDLGHDLPVTAGDTITDAALIVSVNGLDRVELVAVHPQIDDVRDGEVTVLGAYIRAIALDGFGSPYGIQRGYPPNVAPSELLPVAGAVLRRQEFPPLSYEIMIGLSIKQGTAHVSAVSVDYQGVGGVATLTFRQDLTICVAPAVATDCRGRR